MQHKSIFLACIALIVVFHQQRLEPLPQLAPMSILLALQMAKSYRIQ